MKPETRLVYSPAYDISFFGLERFHPFDSRKYSRAWRELQGTRRDCLPAAHLDPGEPVDDETLRLVHTDQYLHELLDPSSIATALELSLLAAAPLPLIQARVLAPMQLATQGTTVAARAALEHGIGANLSGGYHYAGPARGEGFCLFGDVALAVARLRRERLLRPSDRVLYVDLDAHQGNGVARLFMADPRVCILDMYNGRTYPQDHEAAERIDIGVPLDPGTRDAEYLRSLSLALDRAMELGPYALGVYNAGTDVFQDDSLGGLKLSAAAVLQRDQAVVGRLVAAELPLVMVPSGGYSARSYQLLAASLEWMLQQWPPTAGASGNL